MTHFIDEVENRVYLKEYIRSLEDFQGLYDVYRAVIIIDDFRHVFHYQVRDQVAHIIMDILSGEDFLASNVVSVSDMKTEYVNGFVQGGILPTEMFDSIVSPLTHFLEDQVFQGFVQSEYFHKFVCTTLCKEPTPVPTKRTSGYETIYE